MLRDPMVTRVFAGHDAGAYALPSKLIEARAVVNGLQEMIRTAKRRQTQLENNRREPINAAANALMTAVAAGNAPTEIDTSPLVAARRDLEQAEDALAIAAAASDDAQRHLSSLLTTDTGAIRAALNAAIADVMKTVGSVMPSASRLPWTDAEKLLRRTPPERRIFDVIDAAAMRYDLIEQAHRSLPGAKVDGPFGEFRDVESASLSRDRRLRLVRIVERGHVPWVPSPEERRTVYKAWQDAGPQPAAGSLTPGLVPARRRVMAVR